MALAAIKIGVNEPETYDKYNCLAKHLDICEFLHEKGNGSRINSLGARGNKLLLGLAVDTSHMTNEGIAYYRSILKQKYLRDGAEKVEAHEDIVDGQLWHLDLAALTPLSIATKNAINNFGAIRSNIRPTLYQYMADNQLATSTVLKDKTISNLDTELARVEQMRFGNSGRTIYELTDYLIAKAPPIVSNASLIAQRRISYVKELWLDKNKIFTSSESELAGDDDTLRTKAAAYHQTDEGKRCLIDRLTREHLSEKQEELIESSGLDMNAINDFSKVISWSDFSNAVKNKKTNQTLSEY